MREVTFASHLAIVMLLEMSAAGSFILKVYIICISISSCILYRWVYIILYTRLLRCHFLCLKVLISKHIYHLSIFYYYIYYQLV